MNNIVWNADSVAMELVRPGKPRVRRERERSLVSRAARLARGVVRRRPRLRIAPVAQGE